MGVSHNWGQEVVRGEVMEGSKRGRKEVGPGMWADELALSPKNWEPPRSLERRVMGQVCVKKMEGNWQGQCGG